jgi:hypothetical protein
MALSLHTELKKECHGQFHHLQLPCVLAHSSYHEDNIAHRRHMQISLPEAWFDVRFHWRVASLAAVLMVFYMAKYNGVPCLITVGPLV